YRRRRTVSQVFHMTPHGSCPCPCPLPSHPILHHSSIPSLRGAAASPPRPPAPTTPPLRHSAAHPHTPRHPGPHATLSFSLFTPHYSLPSHLNHRTPIPVERRLARVFHLQDY